MNRDCKYIVDIDINNVEKRYKPSKYYVYCIWVTWSDSNKYKIYRRYSKFFDLQCKLLDTFKKESGYYDPKERIIPFLPGKKLFGRSQISSVAYDRMHQLNVYCKRLIKIKAEISCSELVLNFFELNQDDIASLTQTDTSQSPTQISSPIKAQEYICIHGFKALTNSEISIQKNQIVSVLEKNLNGWWFVSFSDGQGYVPQSVLKPVSNSNINESQLSIPVDSNEIFIITKDFNAKKGDELTLKKGDYIRVLEKRLNGWWTVEYQNEVGLAPAVCIGQLNKSKLDKKNVFTVDTKSMTSFGSFDSLENSLDTSSFSSIGSDEFYYVLEDYVDPEGESLSLRKGQKCRVLNYENSSGWWFVSVEGKNCEGWAPSTFLTKEIIRPSKPPLPPKPYFNHQALNVQDLIENDTPVVVNVKNIRDMFEKRF